MDIVRTAVHVQCLTLTVILVALPGSAKQDVKKQWLPKCQKESLPQKKWILKKCLRLRLDNPFKQHMLYSSSNDEAKGSISVVWCGRKRSSVGHIHM